MTQEIIAKGTSNEAQKPLWKHQAIPFGESDVAALTLTGCHNGELTASILHTGEDGCYTAYIYEANEDKPDGFELFRSFNNWFKVYDDRGLVVDVYGPAEIYKNAKGSVVIAKKNEETSITPIPR